MKTKTNIGVYSKLNKNQRKLAKIMRSIPKYKSVIDNNKIFDIDIVTSGILEKLLDNTATRINFEQHRLADPEDIVDSPPDKHVHLFYSKLADEQNGHMVVENSNKEKVKVTYFTVDTFKGLSYKSLFGDRKFVGTVKVEPGDNNFGNAHAAYTLPLMKKEWDNFLNKYGIEYITFKNFKKIFSKNKNLSIDEIYNQHLNFDDRIAIASEDAAMFYSYKYTKSLNNYPLFLFTQETVAKINFGYNILKKKNILLPEKEEANQEITVPEAIDAAGEYEFEKPFVPKITLKDLPILENIVKNKISDAITKNDKYYFVSTCSSTKATLFLQDNNIELVSVNSLRENFTQEDWKEKEIDDYILFKNLNFFDLDRNAKYKIKRPDCGWVILPYDKAHGEYLLVPKSLAKDWLELA